MVDSQNEQPPNARLRDTFSDTWGSPTKWKTGTQPSLRFKSKLELDSAYISPRPTESKRSEQLAPMPAADKPLPAIPNHNVASVTEVAPNQADFRSTGQTRRPTSSGSSFGNWFRLLKRRDILKKSAGNHSLEAKIPIDVSIMPQTDLSVTQFYCDKGTQTSPRLLYRDKGNAPRSIWKINFGRPSFAQDEMLSSPALESQTPLWPPSKIAPNNDIADYFSLPSRSVNPKDSKVAHESVNARAELQNSIPEDDSITWGKHHRLIGNETNDSLGTYESRYSESRPETAPAPKTGRPIAKKSMSDSTIPGARKISRGSTSHDFPDGMRVVSNLRSLLEPSLLECEQDAPMKRPMAFPFQRMPSFSGRSRNIRLKSQGSSSQSSNISPSFAEIPNYHGSYASSSGNRSSLRQELNATSNTSSWDPSEPQDTESPLTYIPEMPPVITTEIPDHLRSSPLCPRHAKHKSGGTGFCPIHGQNRTSFSDSSDSEIMAKSETRHSLGVSHRTPESPSTPADGSMSFHLGFPDHRSDDPTCPANMLTKGVCLHHGRALKTSSEDSVPRLGFM